MLWFVSGASAVGQSPQWNTKPKTLGTGEPMPPDRTTTPVEDAEWILESFYDDIPDRVERVLSLAVRTCREAVKSERSTPAVEAQAVFADNLLRKLRGEMERDHD